MGDPHQIRLCKEGADKRMIDTSQEHRRDRFEAVQAGRLSVYMEDVVRRLERLQRGETEEEDQCKMYNKKKQDLWDAQYLRHHKHIASQKGSYEASYILQEILGPRPETLLLDERATPEELKDLEAEARRKDAILDDWHTPPDPPGRKQRTPHMILHPSPGRQTKPTMGQRPSLEERREEEKKKQDMYKELDRRDEESLMKEMAIEPILDMEDGISRKPIPLRGLTCPLTGEQLYIDP